MKKTPKRGAPNTNKTVASVRLSDDLKRRIRDACGVGPYRLTTSALIERGIELALKELSEIKSR